VKQIISHKLLSFLLFILPLMINGCASQIAKFDTLAYQQATSLKVDTLVLIGKATEAYDIHENAIEALSVDIEKAYEYAKGRPKNEIVTKQWAIMNDPERNLLGGFLVRWKNKGSLSNAFVKGAKGNIALGFDQIIGLESGLIKPKDNE